MENMRYTPLTHPKQPISFQNLAQGGKFEYQYWLIVKKIPVLGELKSSDEEY